MYRLKIQHYFDASHQLPDTEYLVTKACSNLHGHTYKVIVELEAGNKALKGGMVLDFKAVKEIINILDHKHVNDVFKEYEFCRLNYHVEGLPQKGEIFESTAENIARFIFEMILEKLKFTPSSVSICEGYKGDDKSSWATYTEI